MSKPRIARAGSSPGGGEESLDQLRVGFAGLRGRRGRHRQAPSNRCGPLGHRHVAGLSVAAVDRPHLEHSGFVVDQPPHDLVDDLWASPSAGARSRLGGRPRAGLTGHPGHGLRTGSGPGPRARYRRRLPKFLLLRPGAWPGSAARTGPKSLLDPCRRLRGGRCAGLITAGAERDRHTCHRSARRPARPRFR